MEQRRTTKRGDSTNQKKKAAIIFLENKQKADPKGYYIITIQKGDKFVGDK